MILSVSALLHPASLVRAHDYFFPPFQIGFFFSFFFWFTEASLPNLILLLLSLLQADVTFTSVTLIKYPMSPPPPVQHMLPLLAKLQPKKKKKEGNRQPLLLIIVWEDVEERRRAGLFHDDVLKRMGAGDLYPIIYIEDSTFTWSVSKVNSNTETPSMNYSNPNSQYLHTRVKHHLNHAQLVCIM